MPTPHLTSAQIAGLVAQYIAAQREKYGSHAIPLTTEQRAAVAGFFASQLLDGVRLLCKSVSPCEPSSWSRLSFRWTNRKTSRNRLHRNLSPRLTQSPSPNLSPSRCQPSREHPGLHLTHHRLPRMAVGRCRAQVAQRGAAAPAATARGGMQDFCGRNNLRVAPNIPRYLVPHRSTKCCLEVRVLNENLTRCAFYAAF